MEAISIQLIHKFGDGSASDYRSYTGRDLTGIYYPKSEVDERIRVAVAHIKNAKNEIGVPSKYYPANIANAVDFLNIAIEALEVK